MKTLYFDAPSHHVLHVDEQEIAGGTQFEVSNERAEQLINDPHASVVNAADAPVVQEQAPDPGPLGGEPPKPTHHEDPAPVPDEGFEDDDLED